MVWSKNPWVWVVAGALVLAVWHARCSTCQEQWARLRGSFGGL